KLFLASRRLHTKSKRDWSSDVCSSDLGLWRARAGARGPPTHQSCDTGGVSHRSIDTPAPASASLPVPGPSPESEAQRRHDLRKHKAIATGLLIFAAIVFVICRIVDHGGNAPAWVGYVQAAAEAGMVGGIADWFAVTALFRHPLGLP